MAFRKRSRAASSRGRAGYGRRSSTRRASARSVSRRSAQQTLKIVIEQPTTSAVARPELAGMTLTQSRKRTL